MHSVELCCVCVVLRFAHRHHSTFVYVSLQDWNLKFGNFGGRQHDVLTQERVSTTQHNCFTFHVTPRTNMIFSTTQHYSADGLSSQNRREVYIYWTPTLNASSGTFLYAKYTLFLVVIILLTNILVLLHTLQARGGHVGFCIQSIPFFVVIIFLTNIFVL